MEIHEQQLEQEPIGDGNISDHLLKNGCNRCKYFDTEHYKKKKTSTLHKKTALIQTKQILYGNSRKFYCDVGIKGVLRQNRRHI